MTRVTSSGHKRLKSIERESVRRKDGSKESGSPNESVVTNVDDAIDLLNWIAKNDPELVQGIVTNRMKCNQETWEHQTIQVGTYTTGDGPKQCDVSLVGILNGIFGTIKGGKLDGYGYIAVILDENGKVLRFERTEDAIEEVAKHQARFN